MTSEKIADVLVICDSEGKHC